MVEPKIIIIDLFCGAGGTTTGFENVPGCVVISCVNHDENAIRSHEANHPDAEHFIEDITLMYGMVKNGILFKSSQLVHLMRLVDLYRAFYPDIKLILWASLECTNFSKAKGGQSRDADSRTLANHMDRYYVPLQPDYIMIENVVEFMAWGPLTARVSKTEEGYKCCEIQIVEVMVPVIGVDGHPVIEAVDGNADNTRIRMHRKLQVQYDAVPNSKKNGNDFLKWNEHVCSFGYHKEWKELNSADFGAYTSRNRLFGIFAKDDLPIVWPEPTHEKKQKAKGKKRKAEFADHSMYETPAGALLSNPKMNLVTPFIMPTNYDNKPTGIDEPLTTITANRKHHYIINPSHGGHATGTDAPCPVVVARQDKAPLYLLVADAINSNTIGIAIRIDESDSEIMRKIKVFMVLYDIVDIKMRMLKILELLLIQGFPKSYKLKGTQAEQKKFIGNAVHPLVPENMANALLRKLDEVFSKAA